MHFQFTEYACIRVLLEMMVIEYAHRQEYTQSMLFSFASAFFLQAVRYGRAAGQLCDAEPLSDRLLRYIEDHSDTVTLKALSDRFFYQPGYLSALIKRKFGKSFTALLSDQRMKKGGILLKNTSLSVEEIARDRLQQCQQLLPLLPEILPYVAAGIRRTVFLKGALIQTIPASASSTPKEDCPYIRCC